MTYVPGVFLIDPDRRAWHRAPAAAVTNLLYGLRVNLGSET
jgi:hypothetical protein